MNLTQTITRTILGLALLSTAAMADYTTQLGEYRLDQSKLKIVKVVSGGKTCIVATAGNGFKAGVSTAIECFDKNEDTGEDKKK